jgi:hypothetical protein
MVDSGKMPRRSGKKIRCAIYTRKSTDEGLEQAFNSLDAQREACAAYVLSQKHEGRTVLPSLYDDGGYSGGNMERPALQRLIAEIEAGKVDVIVVYKVDRLTRATLPNQTLDQTSDDVLTLTAPAQLKRFGREMRLLVNLSAVMSSRGRYGRTERGKDDVSAIRWGCYSTTSATFNSYAVARWRLSAHSDHCAGQVGTGQNQGQHYQKRRVAGLQPINGTSFY